MSAEFIVVRGVPTPSIFGGGGGGGSPLVLDWQTGKLYYMNEFGGVVPVFDSAAAAAVHTHPLSAITDLTISAVDLNTLDDGVSSALHFHNADRARANHTGTQAAVTITGLGTAAPLDVPASGDAAAGEVVKGSDTRLSNARAPTAHTHAWSGITGTPATLAGYGIGDAAAASHSHSNVVASGAAGFMTGADKALLDALALPRTVLIERRTSDYSNATTSPTNIFTGLTTVANAIYRVTGRMTTQCSSVGGNAFSIVAPAGAVVEGWAKGVLATLVLPSYQRIAAINTLTGLAMNVAIAIPAPLNIDALVVCGATIGTLTVGGAVVVATQVNTVFTNSVLSITRVA